MFKKLSLRGKLITPYLLLALAVTVVAAFVMGQIIRNSLADRFDNLLITTAGEMADAVTLIEEDQLAVWRRIGFTEGVPEAVAAADLPALQQLVGPIAIDATIDRVVLISLEGDPLLRFDGDGQELSLPATYVGPLWNDIQTNLREAERWDRFARLLPDDDDMVLYTGGVLTDPASGEATGILYVGNLVGTIADFGQRMVLANVTIFNSDGQLLATTHLDAVNTALSLDPALAQTILLDDTATPQRLLTLAGDEYAQAFTPFEISFYDQQMGIIGVSLPTTFLETSLDSGRWPLTIVFSLAVAATLLIGQLLAGHILRPIERLKNASQDIAQGDLSVQVPVSSADEVGQLTLGFNEMVRQLRERRYIEDLFGRYVGDNIAREILAGDVVLGGQRVVATALFSDIRDFTSLTEQSTDLVRFIDELNEYYTAMQHAIDANGGVINKFGGDSILALFGAPVSHEDHAYRAVKAAVAMEEALTELNKRRQTRGDAPFRIGIGINTGEMIAGNLGSEQRLEYTVLGDSVNSAKRLSDLNKETPFHNTLFISDSTFADLPTQHEGWQFDSIGEVSVKGKAELVGVYVLMNQ